ncbi:MAG: helix-turn-helix domain-containing protein [Candidatus Magasanikbacteria bacterium]
MKIDNTTYTVKQLADILGVSRIAVFKKIQNGAIKAKKVGKTYYIPRKELKGIVYSDLSDKLKNEIEYGVKKVIVEYGDLLKMLGKE